MAISIPTAIQYAALAKKMANVWANRESATWGKRTIPEADLIRGLEALFNADFLSAADVIAGDTSAVERGVKLLQNFFKLDEVDGILGQVTKRAIEKSSVCGKPIAEAPLLDPQSLPAIVNEGLDYHFILYYISPELEEKFGKKQARDMVATAWQLWVRNSDKIAIRREDKVERANVVIRLGQIDGPGGTLGMAHVGGPRITQRLECKMDDREPWDEELFTAALCHELGHILGLQHSDTPGQLMNPFLSGKVLEPKDGDTAALRKLWA